MQAPANKAALWTVILAGMAPADVFNLKQLHHSPVVNYRFTTQNRPLSLVISKNLQISPDFKDIRQIALLFKGFCFQQVGDTVNHYSRSRYKKYVHHVPIIPKTAYFDILSFRDVKIGHFYHFIYIDNFEVFMRNFQDFYPQIMHTA